MSCGYWPKLFDKYAKEIIVSEKFDHLTKLQRLAVSITIIGSSKVELYNLAFRVLW